MDSVHQLAELVERSRLDVELRTGGIDAEEVRCRERTSLLAHHAVRDRNGERRKRLDDVEAHLPHDSVKPTHDLAERTELSHEHGVYRVCAARGRRLHLNVEVASLGPFRNAAACGKETRLRGKHAHFAKPHGAFIRTGTHLLHRDVVPRLRERYYALLRLLNYLTAAHGRSAEVRAQHGTSFPRRIKGKTDCKFIPLPTKEVRIRCGCLFHVHCVNNYTT